MLLIQVILGGITRLTGSGLSITQWDVAAGVIPPLNVAQWQDAFEKYQHTPQYRLVNFGFTLSDFKFIFFWEWFHRFWARMVGVVFLVGFVWLLLKNKIRSSMVRPLIILFLLGALQGVIGWIMVASGLTGDAIYVEPTRLAMHFIFALVLIVYTFWLGLQLTVPLEARLGGRGTVDRPARVDGSARGGGPAFAEAPAYAKASADKPAGEAGLRRWTVAILVVLIFQLIWGALMAGHKAANVASTWPDINGDLIPSGMFRGSWLENAVGNRITVQFIHRTLAYLLLVLVLIWTTKAARLGVVPAPFRSLRWLPLLLILLQIILGISSLLTSPWIRPHHWVAFDWLAQLHQITGLLFLMTMVGNLYLLMPVRRSLRV